MVFSDNPESQSVPGIFWRTTLWNTTELPIDNTVNRDRAKDVTQREPTENGLTFRALEIPPDIKDAKKHIEILQELNKKVKQKYPPTATGCIRVSAPNDRLPKGKNFVRPTSPMLTAMFRPEAHPRLGYALAHEIYSADPQRRAFVLDTRVRALAPLAEQCPTGTDARDWQRAIDAAGHHYAAVVRAVGLLSEVAVLWRLQSEPKEGPVAQWSTSMHTVTRLLSWGRLAWWCQSFVAWVSPQFSPTLGRAP